MTVRVKLRRDNLTIIGVYASKIGHKTEGEQFYNELQDVFDKTNKTDYLIIAGDLNARIGIETINDLIGHYGKMNE